MLSNSEYENIAKEIAGGIMLEPRQKSLYNDLFHLLREWDSHYRGGGHSYNAFLRENAGQAIEDSPMGSEFFYEVWKSALCIDSRSQFESYLQYVELNRKPEDRFFEPRQGYLKNLGIVSSYQDVMEHKLDLLTISLPKRAGKSQMGINFACMCAGQDPNKSILMEGTGDDLVKSFHNGCLEYVATQSDYLFYDMFPGSPLVQTNADTKIINLKDKSRFPTIMCRSIDARQVGLSEASKLLYLDDCVEGHEEAMNRQRLDDKWEVISGDILGRALEGTPIVACGTRYSLYDPIGRLQEMAVRLGWRWKAIEVPALDLVSDESNYEYYNPKTGLWQFTTKWFREQRDMLSSEQWEAEFQQHPFESKGVTLPEKELNYYFELPVDLEPDGILAVCDTAESGNDSVAMPIGYIYGEDVYLEAVVFDNSPPEITKPECAKLLTEHNVGNATFESNLAGTYFARDVEELMKGMGGHTSIRTKRTVTNKATRIEMASDYIKKHYFFKHPSTYKRGSQYDLFMREATTHTRTGKVPHDDAIDSLSLHVNELQGRILSKATVQKRFF